MKKVHKIQNKNYVYTLVDSIYTSGSKPWSANSCLNTAIVEIPIPM